MNNDDYDDTALKDIQQFIDMRGYEPWRWGAACFSLSLLVLVPALEKEEFLKVCSLQYDSVKGDLANKEMEELSDKIIGEE